VPDTIFRPEPGTPWASAFVSFAVLEPQGSTVLKTLARQPNVATKKPRLDQDKEKGMYGDVCKDKEGKDGEMKTSLPGRVVQELEIQDCGAILGQGRDDRAQATIRCPLKVEKGVGERQPGDRCPARERRREKGRRKDSETMALLTHTVTRSLSYPDRNHLHHQHQHLNQHQQHQ
jgi:hypothetical protein